MDNTRREYTESNRRAWNEVMPLHQLAARARWDAAFQVPGHVALDEDMLVALRYTGIQGKRVAQLCCNNGVESLSLKNLGAARCVGFDISDEAVSEARSRARLCGIDCEFVRTDVHSIDAAYDGEFDLVCFTAGSLGWLPDLPALAERVAALLCNGGQVLIHEMHPFAEMLPTDDQPDADPLRIVEPYFGGEPYVDYGGLDYVGGKTYTSRLPQYWFVHTLGEIITALVHGDLAIERLKEYPLDIGATHRRQEAMAAGIALSYTLIARKATSGGS